MSVTRTNEVRMLDDIGKAGFTFDSVEDMKQSTSVVVGQKVRTLGYYAPGDGGGCDYEIVAAGAGSNYGFLFEQLTASGHEAKLLAGGIMEDKTAYIPTDYDTLQEAIDNLYTVKVKSGARITLLVKAGHQPVSGILVSNGDYCQFRVASEDAVVTVGAGYTGDFIRARPNANAPALACLVDANKLGGDGVHASNKSQVFVEADCGVINAGGRGLYCSDASTAFARRGNFSGAWNRGLWITRNSNADVEFGKFNNCNESLAVATSNSVRRCSHVNAQDAEFNNNFNTGINASRASTLNLAGASISNNGGEGVRSGRASLISLEGSGAAIVNGNTITGLRCFRGGIIQAGGIEAKNNGGFGDFAAATGIIFSEDSIITGDLPANRVYTSIARDQWLTMGDAAEGARFNTETHYYEAWGSRTADLTTSGLQSFDYPSGLDLASGGITMLSHSFSGSPPEAQRNAIGSAATYLNAGTTFDFACNGTGSTTRSMRVVVWGYQDLTAQF